MAAAVGEGIPFQQGCTPLRTHCILKLPTQDEFPWWFRRAVSRWGIKVDSQPGGRTTGSFGAAFVHGSPEQSVKRHDECCLHFEWQ
ncbi:hypothetical protein OPV22_032130 [Ensete ventricosum]|uniref:RRM domain-containing protein n=1 Tax=Ensete ventricosum TaxID=4639 RepID=A0AAV8PKD8_ENSVE|nr:hypothetical protein OPV22_032130 [Ensete ventricosum]